MKKFVNRVVSVTLAAAALVVTASGHETDQFTLPPGREFADLGEYFNNWFFDAIDKGVAKANERVRACIADRRSSSELASLESSDEVVRAVNAEFPNAYDVIEGIETLSNSPQMKQQYPGKVIGYKEQFTNIFEHVHFPLDPRQIFRIWHASTIKVYGTYLGGDKMGHFTDMGMHYYRAYSEARARGASEKAAVAAAVDVGTHGPIFSERGMVGYLSAGAYSNGDLAANYLGFLFYKNLTQPVSLKGQLHQPMLIKDGHYWKLAPNIRRDSDFFADFISDHLNEALNPSHFESDMRNPVFKAVKDRKEIILARFCDQHGNRRPRSYFDDVLRDVHTYYGEDYGYDGPDREMITIGDTCFEALPPNAAVTARDSSGNTPLHIAAARGDLAAVTRLLQQGADVNATVRSAEWYSSEWGNTPLHYAARDGRLDVAAKLIEAGASVNAANQRGQTPLHRALGHPDVAALLIQKGASASAADDRGQTPLHWAAGDGQGQAVALLISQGATVNQRDHCGETPLHLAARSGNPQVVGLLVDKGADCNAKGSFQMTPLHIAAARGDAGILEILLGHRANVQAKDEFGRTPLHDAAEQGRTDAGSLLLTRGADVQASDAHGATPLHLASRNGREPMVLLLVSKGAPVNARNAMGMTPLHEAAFSGDKVVIAELLAQGADGTIRSSRGLGAFDIAQAKGAYEVASMLRSSSWTVSSLGARSP